MGLYTIIGKENRDASGQILDTAVRSKIERLRTWDNRTHVRTSTDRNFMKAFAQLERLKEKLGLSNTIVEKAAYIYRKIQERGQYVAELLTACWRLLYTVHVGNGN
jgi:transcription initiation factor TFIIB